MKSAKAVGCITGVLLIVFVVLSRDMLGFLVQAFRVNAWLGIGILTVIAGLLLTRFALFMKRIVLNALPDEIQFTPIAVEDYPERDEATLQRDTQALEALGFEQLFDYTLDTGLSSMPPGFARLFVHPHHHCFAEINQAFPPGRPPVAMCSMIASLLEDGWSLSTSNRAPDGISYMLRRPRSLWVSQPDRGPRTLLAEHLERRREITADLGVAVVNELKPETFFAHQRQDMTMRKTIVQRRFILYALLEAMLFSFRPKYIWMGEYTSRAVTRALE